ncbi:hypothetical protein G0029_06430 [Acinetobacter sp. YH12138]|uniref:hypothetical protein n=1 Tax=Acinetobacter sp. YH12138 TaxID=2601122 RepID=UPI0015D29538|nr:hypothetical protein [Acinetobacter sp. YH12138]QOW49467.1 hypothetical protein G0029_06430 [Acinetobacter sp. YH12138]
MDIQKEKHNYLAMLVAEDAITQEQCSNLSLYNGGNYFHSDFLASSKIDCINWGWSAWLKAKTQAVPEGFVLVPKDRLAKAVDGIEALFEEDCTLALGQLLPIQQDLNAMMEAQGPAND